MHTKVSTKETDSIIKIDKLNAFQQRVMDEYYELSEKHEKLGAFICTEKVFGALPADEQERLQRQAGIMFDYINVLQERVMNFVQDPSA